MPDKNEGLVSARCLEEAGFTVLYKETGGCDDEYSLRLMDNLLKDCDDYQEAPGSIATRPTELTATYHSRHTHLSIV